MSNFAHTLRGDGLVRVQRALAALQKDPLRLKRERQRFSHPPPYVSESSGSTTLSVSSSQLSEEQLRLRQRRKQKQKRLEQRRSQLVQEYSASQPWQQFSDQTGEEVERVTKASLAKICRIPSGSDALTIARDNIKKIWVEQGIWNDKWDMLANGLWKHEEPLELESEPDGSDLKDRLLSLRFSFDSRQPQSKRRRLKSDVEKLRITQRRVEIEREREASRPYHQFVYQVSRERKRIQEESTSCLGADAVDINTIAYEHVKSIWTRRRIWNRRWCILPGMWWKHEQPFRDFVSDCTPFEAVPLGNGTHEASDISNMKSSGVPLQCTPRNPTTNPSRSDSSNVESSLVEVQHCCGSDDTQKLRKGLFDGFEPTGSKHYATQQSSSVPSSAGTRIEKHTHCLTEEQASPVFSMNSSHDDAQSARTTFNPFQSSEVSKIPKKRKREIQRSSRTLGELSSDGIPFPSSVDEIKAQPLSQHNHLFPRRSRRIQQIVSNGAKDAARTTSADASKHALTSKIKRKPQRSSRRQPAKIVQGKARNQ